MKKMGNKICKKCGKVFRRTYNDKSKLCDKCWLSRSNGKIEYKKPNSKIKICIRCDRKRLIYAKGLCMSCYINLNRLKRLGKKQMGNEKIRIFKSNEKLGIAESNAIEVKSTPPTFLPVLFKITLLPSKLP